MKLFEHDRRKIVSVGQNDAVVYNIPDGDSAMLQYKVKYTPIGGAICKLTINNTPNMIHYVRFYLKPYIFFAKHKVEEISKDDFVKLYNGNKWLQRKLAKQGYHSIGELITR